MFFCVCSDVSLHDRHSYGVFFFYVDMYICMEHLMIEYWLLLFFLLVLYSWGVRDQLLSLSLPLPRHTYQTPISFFSACLGSSYSALGVGRGFLCVVRFSALLLGGPGWPCRKGYWLVFDRVRIRVTAGWG